MKIKSSVLDMISLVPLKYPKTEFKCGVGYMEFRRRVWARDVNIEKYLGHETGWFQTVFLVRWFCMNCDSVAHYIIIDHFPH